VKHPLSSKLILSFLAVALLTVLVVSLVIRLNSGTSLMELVVEQQISLLSESVKNYYTNNGSLEGFTYYDQRTNPAGNQPGKSGDGMGQGRQLRGLYGLVDTEYKAVLPAFGIPVGQRVSEDKIKHAVAVEVNGQTIAWIIPDVTRQFELSAE